MCRNERVRGLEIRKSEYANLAFQIWKIMAESGKICVKTIN